MILKWSVDILKIIRRKIIQLIPYSPKYCETDNDVMIYILLDKHWIEYTGPAFWVFKVCFQAHLHNENNDREEHIPVNEYEVLVLKIRKLAFWVLQQFHYFASIVAELQGCTIAFRSMWLLQPTTTRFHNILCNTCPPIRYQICPRRVIQMFWIYDASDITKQKWTNDNMF